MMPHKTQKKKDDDHHDDQKNPKKKGKAVIPNGTVGMGQGQPSSDSGHPELDIDSAMQMMAKPLRLNKPALASKEEEAIRKPVFRRADALTAALGHALEEPQAPTLRSHPSHQKQRSPGRSPNPMHHHPHQMIQPHQTITMTCQPKKMVQAGETRPPSVRCLMKSTRRSWLTGGGSTWACTTKATKHTQGRLKRTG